jgi:hypothetical protein
MMERMDDAPRFRRRWFRFSLRTLFVAVTGLCIGLVVVSALASMGTDAAIFFVLSVLFSVGIYAMNGVAKGDRTTHTMTTPYHPRPERWPQFTLRGLFVLVTIFGVAMWLGVQVRWIRDRHAILEGTADWSGTIPLRRAPWSIHLFGETGYEQIHVPIPDIEHPTADDRRLKRHVESLFPEADVGFTDPFPAPP